MLPTSQQPDDISEKWAKRLKRIFGDESWRNLYQRSSPGQTCLEMSNIKEIQESTDSSAIYKENLKNLFGKRFLEKSQPLRNSKNSILFEFMFCVGNPRGIGPATKIASHILEHM